MAKLAVMAVMAAIVAVFAIGRATARVAEGGPDRLGDTASLIDRIRPGKTLHIVYVHGMRASKAGAADPLIALLIAKLGFHRDGDVHDETLTLGARPAGANYLGDAIWKNEAEWDASRPFVLRHTLLRSSDQARVVVDEVNWWPLLFPLKCRFLVRPEHDLSGNDKQHIELCSRTAPADHYYPWLDAKDLAWLRGKPKGGGAALANRALKQQIMNWGLSDAVIVGGPMRVYTNAAMDRAFDYARSGATADDTFIVMSESLGSFVVMDAMAFGSEAVTDVLDRTDDLYFFANQFALLELGRIQGLPQAVSAPPVTVAGMAAESRAAVPTPLEALAAWGRSSAANRRLAPDAASDRPRQIIAFSDPSDLLTYYVPPIAGVVVVNLYDRNATRWFGVVENPAAAHAAHLRNAAVWKILTRQ